MAIVLIEGGDHLAATLFTLKGWSVNPASLQTGRFAGSSFRIGGTVTPKALPSSYSTLICGFAVKGFNALTEIFRFRDASGNNIARLRISGGVIQVLNAGGTVIASGTTAIVASGVWYYIELEVVVNGAAGSCVVRLNGASEIAATTGNFGSTNIGQVAFGATDSTADYDDVYALDTSGAAPRNTFLGDVRVGTVMPTADGTHSQWTPSSGTNHFDRVNESSPNDDTTYVSDATPGDLDTYAFGDIDGGATVFGVQTNLYARKDDANTRQVAPVIRQGGTDFVGSTVTLGSSYQFFSQLYNQDPTAADWTASNVNGDEFGVKTIA